MLARFSLSSPSSLISGLSVSDDSDLACLDGAKGFSAGFDGAKGLTAGFDGAKGLAKGVAAGFDAPKILAPADGLDVVGKPNFGGAGVVVGVVDVNIDVGLSTAGVVDVNVDWGFSTAGVVASIASSLVSTVEADLAASLSDRPKPPPKKDPSLPCWFGSLSLAVFGSALNVVPRTNVEPKAGLL